MDLQERAKPLADNELTKKLFSLIEKANGHKKLKRGANEAAKSLNRDQSELILLAADATPLEIILHLPLLCEDKSVPYIFVPSMAELGQACGTSRNVVACSIIKKDTQDQALEKEIKDMRIVVEKCYYENINE